MKRIFITGLVASLSLSAHADMLLGGDVEATVWSSSAELNGKDAGETSSMALEASLEHGLPLIPNIKAASSSSSADDFSYTKQDYTLYYEILDNDLVSIDTGVGVTMISSGVLSHNGGTTTNDFEGMLPHAYLAVEVGIPATPLFVYAKGNGTSYDGSTMIDASVGAQYEAFSGPIDVELLLGYRVQQFTLDGFDDLPEKAEADVGGFFVGVNLDF